MNIVVVGAGQTGRHISSLLSQENHNVVLLDTNLKRLEIASWNADVAIKEGSAVDWQLLDGLLDLSPDLFIALTSNDQTNLVACSLAKNLGYPKTVARVRDNRYLNRTRLDFARIFDVDYFIGPELLVAYEINKFLLSPGALRVESFAHGAVQLRTFLVPSEWDFSGKTLRELKLPEGMMFALVARMEEGKKKVIFPHGNDHILAGDEVTLIGKSEVIYHANEYFGVSQKKVKSVVIVGGSRTAINLASILHKQDIDVRLIEMDHEVCSRLSDKLPYATVIHQDGTNLDFLKSEKVHLADAFIVSTHLDEFNMMTGLLGKEAGCEKVIVQLANPGYASIAESAGISHVTSPRTLAGNRILAIAHSQRISSMVSFYDNQADVMEIQVSMDSPLVGIPISALGPHLPDDFLVGVIQNRGRVMIADGSKMISPGDTVIVVSNSKHIKDLEEIF